MTKFTYPPTKTKRVQAQKAYFGTYLSKVTVSSVRGNSSSGPSFYDSYSYSRAERHDQLNRLDSICHRDAELFNKKYNAVSSKTIRNYTSLTRFFTTVEAADEYLADMLDVFQEGVAYTVGSIKPEDAAAVKDDVRSVVRRDLFYKKFKWKIQLPKLVNEETIKQLGESLDKVLIPKKSNGRWSRTMYYQDEGATVRVQDKTIYTLTDNDAALVRLMLTPKAVFKALLAS